MDQLNKANQDNKCLKKMIMIKVPQNQVITTKYKVGSKDTGTKAPETGQP